MPYKMSRCVCLETPDKEGAIKFYRDVFGLEVQQNDGECTELDGDHFRLFIDQREKPQVIFEFLVPNLEQARDELVAAGCEVLRWEGKGKPCYLRDPYGMIFNLWEVA